MAICFVNLYIKFCIDIFRNKRERVGNLAVAEFPALFFRDWMVGRKSMEKIKNFIYMDT